MNIIIAIQPAKGFPGVNQVVHTTPKKDRENTVEENFFLLLESAMLAVFKTSGCLSKTEIDAALSLLIKNYN